MRLDLADWTPPVLDAEYWGRPVLLDLCCKAGGASMGYYRAGFRVIGFDSEEQPAYPFEFHRVDVTRLDLPTVARAYGAVAVAGSPPCKLHTALKHAAKMTAGKWDHINIIEPVRAAMIATGLPYIIENVPLAPLISPLTLCGTEFDLKAVDQDGATRHLRRHRLFESNVALVGNGGCNGCSGRGKGPNAKLIGGVYGGGGGAPRARVGRDGKVRGGYQMAAANARELLGVPWMNRDEADQAIPPVYTEWLGRQLMRLVTREDHP